MAAVPFSYTDAPSTTSSIKYSTPYAEIESTSSIQLLTDDSSQSGRSASVVFHGRNSSSSTFKLALASLALSIICMVLTVAAVVWWVLVQNDGQPLPGASGSGQDREEVCLPCVQIGPNPLDASTPSLWNQLDVRYDADDLDNATKICCASTSAQFAVLFKLILQRQQAVKELADSIDRKSKDVKEDTKDDISSETSVVKATAVSAHLVFKPEEINKREVLGQPREQQWKSPSESPMSHVHKELSFKDKRIQVQTPGLYYVYCQILYSPYQSSSSDVISSGPDVASAYVRRYSILRPAAPDFLLKSRHTRHDLTHDRHSSYVGGVFYLHRGDTLYVQVSRPDLISHDDVASFFGLFRIGD